MIEILSIVTHFALIVEVRTIYRLRSNSPEENAKAKIKTILPVL